MAKSYQGCEEGERFIAAKLVPSHDPRSSVRLKSGITVSWMNPVHYYRQAADEVELRRQQKESRKLQSGRKAELDDTPAFAAKRDRGVNYCKVLTVASNGDKEALAQFFSFGEFMGGATAEPGGYYTQTSELFHVVGDKTFAKLVRGLPLADQVGVRRNSDPRYV